MTDPVNRRTLLSSAIALPLTGLAAKAMADITKQIGPRPAPPLADIYVRSPYIEDASLSPDGKHVAFVTKSNGLYYVVSQNLETKKKTALELGTLKVRRVSWGSNRHVLVVTSVTSDLGQPYYLAGRDEYSIVRTFNIETGEQYELFSNIPNMGNIVDGQIHRFKRNDKYYIGAPPQFHATRQMRALYLFDLETNKAELLREKYCSDLYTPSGLPVARTSQSRGGESHTWIWKLEIYTQKKWKKVFLQRENVDTPVLLGIGQTEASVIVLMNAGDYAGQYVEINDEGTITPLDSGAGFNPSPLFHPVTQRFCGFADHDDTVRYNYSDPTMQKLADLSQAALSDYRVRIVEYASEDPRKMLIHAENSADPGGYYFLNLADGKSMLVGDMYPDLPQAWVAKRSAISYTAADGLEIHGYLTLPPHSAEKNLPLILLPHGGPQARDTLKFDWESQLYASRGYAVLQPNFRGSTGYGKAFVEKAYGEWGRKMQTDLSDGVRYLVKQGTVDAKRVAIVGASYGGYAALAGATIDRGVYNCAVSVAGVADLRKMFGDRSIGNYPSALYWHRFLGDPKHIDEVSPAQRAKDCDIPVLLIHGSDDIIVPIEQSKIMEKALKKAGKNVTFIELKGEDHWGSVEEKRLESSNAIIAFLEKHNPPS